MKSIATLIFLAIGIDAFLTPTTRTSPFHDQAFLSQSPHRSSSSLNVWWFGGTEQGEMTGDDSCELVAVRIERTSPNSRRIAGDIVVPARLDKVWNILTDYDRLAIHVPNLRESKIKQRNSGGEPGDGKFRCRLFQVGAQKIIGFDFSASVTMDMTERIISDASDSPSFIPQERMIGFKCVDSQFFTEFDGDWKLKEQIGPDGEIETQVSYNVEVRPKGPVPVAALEWQIREEVPTNLRAVKKATIGQRNEQRNDASYPVRDVSSLKASSSRSRSNGYSQQRLVPVPVMADWDRDETMAKYL